VEQIRSGKIILVTGAASSGKSEWAEKLATETDSSVIYIATAQRNPNDPEWEARLDKHQQRRSPTWTTWEVPLELTATLTQATPSTCLLIDSLGTWVANLLEEDDVLWEQTTTQFLETLRQVIGDVILVSEETGWGVVPAYPMGRQFRDRLGKLTRQIGELADIVYLVTTGYALNLKLLGHPLNLIK